MSRSKVRGKLYRVHRTDGSITAYGQYSVKKLPQFSYIKMNDLRRTVYDGNQKPKKKKLIFVLFAFLVHNSTYTNVIP